MAKKRFYKIDPWILDWTSVDSNFDRILWRILLKKKKFTNFFTTILPSFQGMGALYRKRYLKMKNIFEFN